MDRSRMADIPGDVIPHSCQHCDNIVLTLGDPISSSFPYSEIERALAAKCEFFELCLAKHLNADTTWLSRCSSLRVYCGGRGHLDFRWMDGRTRLFGSASEIYGASPLFAPENSPYAAHFKVRPLNSTPGSEESFRHIRRWIRGCNMDHNRCKDLRTKLRWKRPTSLIDVGTADSKEVCLCSTVPGSDLQYAALSYCWGGEQKSKTTDARLEERRKGFPLEELSRIIQDAVVTTRRLELRYLWVDAICIIQDDETDKEREIAIMDQVYSGAFITIVAARAKGAGDGFLQERDVNQQYGTVCRVKYRRSSTDTRSVLLSAKSLKITYDDPLDERGWTFQEHYQSFRTLRFGSKQTVWEYPDYYHVDGGENYSPKTSSYLLFTGTVKDSVYPYQLNDVSHKIKLDQALGQWQQLVQEYSRRTLSKRADRLPAFAAMAKAFGTYMQLEPEQYLAGLWAFDICMQLQWWRSDNDLEERWYNGRHGPTWSWASLDGPITFDHAGLPYGVDTLQLVKDECQIHWKSPDFKYGEVHSARLTVIGFLRRSIWSHGRCTGWHYGKKRYVPLPLKAYWDCCKERSSETWCLEINTNTSRHETVSSGILLSHSSGNVYKRLGYFKFYHDGFPGEPIQTGIDIQGLPRNSNWFYNGEHEKYCIE